MLKLSPIQGVLVVLLSDLIKGMLKAIPGHWPVLAQTVRKHTPADRIVFVSEVLCIIGLSGHLLQHIRAHLCLCLSASTATTVGLMLADFFILRVVCTNKKFHNLAIVSAAAVVNQKYKQNHDRPKPV